jgi:murein DD-endopeptidase MepM/ murein hydrolase activator NlpD
MKIVVTDEGGVGAVSVVLLQGEKQHSVVDSRSSALAASARERELTVLLDPAALALAPGVVTISVTATDSSVWGHQSVLVKELPIDLTRPRIEPVSVQQNGTVGGAELIVFRYVGRPAERLGVQLRGEVFSAIPVAAFDPDIPAAESLYVSIFALPYDFNPQLEQLKLVALDDIGNSVEAPFNYRIASRTFSEVEMNLGPQFFAHKVPPLLLDLQRQESSVNLSGDVMSDFKFVNEDLRRRNEQVIREAISQKSGLERLWRGVFVRPMAAAPKASFAEKRLYKRGRETLSQSLHMGVDLADVEQAPVRATNAGKVIYSAELGIYGGLIIIDHGAGVSSLYGHLSGRAVAVGDLVKTAQEIGRTGATGLAGGDHLHFEVRVRGVPVSPLAWWDPLWMKEHAEDKVRSAAAAVTAPKS